MIGLETSRQRQSNAIPGAGAPLASQTNAVNCTSLKLCASFGSTTIVCVMVTKNGLVERAVATILTGSASERTRGRHMKVLSRKVTCPSAPEDVTPLPSSNVEATQLCPGKMM